MPGAMRGDQGLAVLEDPTGRRARWMRRAGRVVFVVFLAWLVAIVLAGLGLIPEAGIPLTRVLRPSEGPPPLAAPPLHAPPIASDLRPALTADQANAVLGPVAVAASPATTAPGRSSTAPGRTKTTVTTTRGRSADAPGRTRATTTATTPVTTSPGKSGKTRTKKPPPGRTK